MATRTFLPEEPPLGSDFLSRQFKPWREWHVALVFLRCFGPVDEAQLLCVEPDPPDVLYRDARFEIKAILDTGRRMHAELKLSLLKDEDGSPQPARYIEPSCVGSAIMADLMRLDERRYLDGRRGGIDLLFYYNKVNDWLVPGSFPDLRSFGVQGWRSVSAVVGENKALVFHAEYSAPDFLRQSVGFVRTADG